MGRIKVIGVNMTYGELLEKLYELSPQQLRLDVTVLTNGEFMPIVDFMIVKESDVLDAGHPYLVEEELKLSE